MFVFELLRHCKRVGISRKMLHNYSVSPESGSYRWDPKRLEADEIQHKDTIEFLKEKAGYVSPQNAGFLYCVFYYAIIDTVNVLLRTNDITLKEKLSGLRQLLSSTVTLEMLKSDAVKLEQRRTLLQNLLSVLDSLGTQITNFDDAIWLGLTISALLEDQMGYIKYSKLQIRYLLNQGRKDEAEAQLTEWEAILQEDNELAELRKSFLKPPPPRPGRFN